MMILVASRSLAERLCQSRHIWDYWRSDEPHIIEMGTVRGLQVGLPTHFHAEDQITFVLSGRRRFCVGSNLIEVSAGQAIRIPAGTPHRSLPEIAEVVCINLYAKNPVEKAASLLTALTDQSIEVVDCAASNVLAVGVNDMDFLRLGSVSQTAARIGMTREAFSRKVRRIHGISPQWLTLIARLNDARHLLQRGHAIAAVAADTGFSDQSHLGRCFLRAFGVTPGRYRAG